MSEKISLDSSEKIYQFADGSGMRSCQLYYCIR